MGRAALEAELVNRKLLPARLDRNDQVIGAYDVGRGLVRDGGGSTIAEVSKEGVVLGNSQMQAGWVEGFTYDTMQTLAAYLHLVDPAFTASS